MAVEYNNGDSQMSGKQVLPPLYENWVPQMSEEFNTRGPYDNPLTVGLLASAPVQVHEIQPQQPHAIVIMPVVLGRQSARMNCPHCLADIATGIRREAGVVAFVSCILLFLFGCWCCCCIPFCMDSCYEIEHSCPNCNKVVGRKN